jgi:hypothetical protein
VHLDHQEHGQSTKPIEIVKAGFGVVQAEEFITPRWNRGPPQVEEGFVATATLSQRERE